MFHYLVSCKCGYISTKICLSQWWSHWDHLVTVLRYYRSSTTLYVTHQKARGRSATFSRNFLPKVQIPLSAVTESRPKVTYHIWPKPFLPPKVKRDFRPKTETESQSYLSRHDFRSQQVPPSVRCPTIPCIWYLSHLAASCQPCGVSLMTRPTRPSQYQMQTQSTQLLPRYSQYTVRLVAPCGWRNLASATQLKLCDLLLATTEFANCSPPKPKVHRMWYDCFWPKPNVRRKCPFIHIRRRNRSRNSVDLYRKHPCVGECF